MITYRYMAASYAPRATEEQLRTPLLDKDAPVNVWGVPQAQKYAEAKVSVGGMISSAVASVMPKSADGASVEDHHDRSVRFY